MRNIIKKGSSLFIRSFWGWLNPTDILPYPKLSIEVTNICNSRCVFCANKIMQRKREHMDMGLFKKAVDEFAATGAKELSFNSCIGDPLLDPDILDRVRYVRNFPQIKFLGFVTTLQWLHKFDIEEFIDAGITWLYISTMFLGRQEYARLFGVDNYEQTLKNIAALIKENKKRKNKISINFSLKNTGQPRKIIANNQDFQLIDNLAGGELLRELDKSSIFVDDWCGSVELPGYLRRRPLYPRLFKPCRYMYNSCIIFSSGKIGLCPCRDFDADSDLILGDIRNNSLAEVWVGEKHTRLVKEWRRKNIIPKICSKCRHYF